MLNHISIQNRQHGNAMGYSENFFDNYLGKEEKQPVRCAVCGNPKNAFTEIREYFGSVHLCSDCFGYIETLSISGKNCLVSFLRKTALHN